MDDSKLEIPAEFVETHIPAMDISGNWHLVPFELVTPGDDTSVYLCFPYSERTQRIKRKSVTRKKSHFGF